MSCEARPKAPPLDSAKGQAFGNLDSDTAATRPAAGRRPESTPVQGRLAPGGSGQSPAFLSFRGVPA